jgi:hypothetical protein
MEVLARIRNNAQQFAPAAAADSEFGQGPDAISAAAVALKHKIAADLDSAEQLQVPASPLCAPCRRPQGSC